MTTLERPIVRSVVQAHFTELTMFLEAILQAGHPNKGFLRALGDRRALAHIEGLRHARSYAAALALEVVQGPDPDDPAAHHQEN